MNDLQASLLDELIKGDLAAIEIELAQLTVVDAQAQAKKQPKCAPLPAELPRARKNPVQLRLSAQACWRRCQ